MATIDVIAAAHAQGGVVVAVHPFREKPDADGILRELAFGAVEMASASMSAVAGLSARSFAALRFCPALAMSDAHKDDFIGAYSTEFRVPIRCSSRDLADAIHTNSISDLYGLLGWIVL